MKNPLRPPKTLLVIGDISTKQVLPDTFRLCIWNWHKCKHPGWQTDFLQLCAQSDLFLAQEARFSPATCALLTESRLQWNGAISFLSPVRQIPTGIAAGCRAPASTIHAYVGAREPVLHIPKMTMRLTYPLARTQLLVLNLHAINFTGVTPFAHTLQQAAQLVETFSGPVIVAGDFNTWSRKRTRALQELAEKLQLQEVSFTPDLRTRYWQRPVDYLFTRGLQVVQAKALPFTSSDHHPLLATLRYRANKPNMLK